MEVEENQPPQKKLKQATLSFFKGKNDALPKRSESQGRKRHGSGNSNSPSKVAKLSKPLTVLSSTVSPNSKLVQKSIDHDSGDQEVSSSSEADSVGIKNVGKCLMDRFIKKIPGNSSHEISSTNNDLDSPIVADKCKNDKENLSKDKATPDSETICSESTNDSDCIILDEQCRGKKSHGDGITAITKLKGFEYKESSTNAAVVIGDLEKDAVGETSITIESDLDVSNTELKENLENVVTSTPVKPNIQTMADPNSTPQSKTTSARKEQADDDGVTSTPDKPTIETIPDSNSTPQSKNISDKKVQIDNGIASTPAKPAVDTTPDSNSTPQSKNTSARKEKVENSNVTLTPDKPTIVTTPDSNSTPQNKSIRIPTTPDKPIVIENKADPNSTPQDKNTSSLEMLGTMSSGKKKGRKVDPVKKAQMEALKQKLKEEKEEQRLAKKRKLEEEKAQKERLRNEAKEAKDKAKQEAKEKLSQEKLEKEKIKEDERLKREEERKVKDEQKLKKQAEIEAKQEEKRKKEEEKKQKEEEKLKEDEEKRKKEEKVKMAFQSFFKTKENQPKTPPNKSAPGGTFIPFELKKDMHLAPTLRRDALCDEKKNSLDEILHNSQMLNTTYLQLLKDGEHRPRKMGRILRKNPKPEDELDVEIVHDSEALKKVIHKVKVLKFHTDNRPPYFGTWRRDTKLNPRNPFQKDEDVFDYEVDSDDEWEEEEPGESLSNSEGEEEKEDKEDDEEEDGWMVPHGYLSEDEGCNEDDDISPEKLKLQQIAKAKAWDEEQKRKFHAVPLVVVGLYFEHSPSISMAGDVRLLYEFKAVVIEKQMPIPTALSTVFDVPKMEDIEESDMKASIAKGPKKQSVPDEAMPDLIRLVHGNIFGIKRLIKEFRYFWNTKTKPASSSSCMDGSFEEEMNESMKDPSTDVSTTSEPAKESGDVNSLDKSMDANSSVLKIKDEGSGCDISKRQLEIKIMAIASRQKRQVPIKTAWFVHDSVLTEFGMEDIQLPNTWVFVTYVPPPSPAVNKATATPAVSKEEDANVKKDESTPAKLVAPKDQRSIMDFAMSKEAAEEYRKSKGESLTSNAATLLVSKAEDASVKMDESTPAKWVVPKDQRSIMDFALTKGAAKELRKSKGESLIPSNENISSEVIKSEIVDLVMPKDKKSGQRSIMDFAKSAQKLEGKNVQKRIDLHSPVDLERCNEENKGPQDVAMKCDDIDPQGGVVKQPQDVALKCDENQLPNKMNVDCTNVPVKCDEVSMESKIDVDSSGAVENENGDLGEKMDVGSLNVTKNCIENNLPSGSNIDPQDVIVID